MIYCCYGCKAPKRYPGCHATCDDYIAQKAEYDTLKAVYDGKRRISQAICGDKAGKVYNALKGYRKNKYKER